MDGFANSSHFNFEMFNMNGVPSPNQNRNQLEDGEMMLFPLDSPETESSGNFPSSGESDVDSNDENPASPLEDIVMDTPPQPEYVVRNNGESEIFGEVTNCLIKGKNIVIECPPGMDRKTSVMKPILNFWQWRKNEEIPLLHTNEMFEEVLRTNAPKALRIYVGTRNFAETSKVVQEIKNELSATNLLWKIKMSVLGQRKNFCLKEEVINSENINHSCYKLIHHRNENIPSTSKRARQEVDCACEYYQLSGHGAQPFILPTEVMGLQQTVYDIEDFVENGRQTNRCPYYDGIYLARDAELVICPTKFLLSPYLRHEYLINLDNAIVFIDDGHDLENQCKKEATIDLSLIEVNKAARVITAITEEYQLRPLQEDIGLMELGEFLHNLSRFMRNIDETNRPDRDEILEVINGLNGASLDIPRLLETVNEYEKNYAHIIEDTDASIMEKLKKFMVILGLLTENNGSFNVKLITRDSSVVTCNRSDTVLKIICADPSLILNPVEEAANSLIVGADVIAPYSSFETDFPDIVFREPLKIQYDDPIISDRLHMMYASEGPTRVQYSLNYDSRNDPEVKKETGRSFIQICQTAGRFGIIGLFHSKDYLQKTLDFWERTPLEENGPTIMDVIRSSVTTVVSELDMRTETDTKRLMNEYQSTTRKKEGAVLFALQRGKVYRNWDLKYDSVRTIVHLSLPWGPWYTNDQIFSKRKFLEMRNAERNCIQNKEWYHKEAFRVLNRSFCCTKKDKKDCGLVIVLDCRMHGERYEFSDMIPDWVGNLVYHERFPSLIDSVASKVEEWTGDEYDN